VLGDSAWWTLLLLLQLVLHRCSAGQFLFMGGCYDISVAGSGVCREARDGACVMYAEKTTRSGQTAGTCTDADAGGNCASGSCNVQIGSNVYCSQCKTGGNVPIDGVCVDKADAVDKCLTADNQEITTEQVCGKCGDNHFLFKGGCYNVDTAPGNLICSAIDEKNTAVCKTCAAGYFKNPANVETSDSCIACGDATGVIVSGATYKGVLNCAVCTAPQAGGSGGTATCTACVDGYYGAACDQNCNESCKSCNGAETTACTSCKTDNNKEYLKVTDPQAGTGECVADETACKGSNTHFLVASAKTCYPCGSVSDGGVADCQTCTSSDSGGAAKAVTVTCSACTAEGKKPNADGTKCVDCAAAGCAKCSDEGVCVECDSSHYLTPTGQCVDDCGKLGGYYADNNVCKRCDPSCAECVGANANQCSACPAGKVLQYTSESNINGGGSCVDECTPRTGAGGCNSCGAVIGGSRYCSKRSTTTEVSINGVCTADNTRTPACSVKDNQGGCTTCASGYFLLDGGCYETGRQPGKSVCTTESGGKCITCANGQTADTSTGVCPACPAGCSTCSNTNTCTACLAGYYLSGTKCVKCSENSTNGSNTITGVPNCVSCAPPTTSGTVTCYATQTPTVDPTDPSVNKGGLSTGAIAGISVAVIAVVGGLVGFLCWWFLCRGKA
ncbi:Variant-specific surface protein, partial [Giardia duodenalis]